MTFQKFRRPTFPIAKKRRKLDECVAVEMTDQQFRCSRRRTGTGIKQRYVEFPPGKCLIEYGQVANDDGQKAETQTGL